MSGLPLDPGTWGLELKQENIKQPLIAVCKGYYGHCWED